MLQLFTSKYAEKKIELAFYKQRVTVVYKEGMSCIPNIGNNVYVELICSQDADISQELYFLLHGGGARGVMAIVAGNEHGDTSLNPGRDWLYFT